MIIKRPFNIIHNLPNTYQCLQPSIIINASYHHMTLKVRSFTHHSCHDTLSLATPVHVEHILIPRVSLHTLVQSDIPRPHSPLAYHAHIPRPHTTPAYHAHIPRPHTTPTYHAHIPRPHTTPTYHAHIPRPHTTPTYHAHTPCPHTTPTHHAHIPRPHTTPTHHAHIPRPHTTSTYHAHIPRPHTTPTYHARIPRPYATPTYQSPHTTPTHHAHIPRPTLVYQTITVHAVRSRRQALFFRICCDNNKALDVNPDRHLFITEHRKSDRQMFYMDKHSTLCSKVDDRVFDSSKS